MNIEKIAEERYPPDYEIDGKRTGLILSYELRQALISGYQLATQRTEELEREIVNLKENIVRNVASLEDRERELERVKQLLEKFYKAGDEMTFPELEQSTIEGRWQDFKKLNNI